MALRQSVQITQRLATISADGYEPILIVGDYVVTATLIATDVIEMCVLPNGYVPTAVKVATDDMDSNVTPTITLDAGIISGVSFSLDNTRTCGVEAFAASPVGQAGGLAIDTNAALSLLAPSLVDRSIGLRVAAAAATLTVGARIRMTVTARPMLNGV